jgi:hypothetical protein
MVFTKPFLYLSVLNFTGRTSHPNRLFRVSKSRNGDPRQREAKRDRGKTIRIAALLSRFGRDVTRLREIIRLSVTPGRVLAKTASDPVALKCWSDTTKAGRSTPLPWYFEAIIVAFRDIAAAKRHRINMARELHLHIGSNTMRD